MADLILKEETSDRLVFVTNPNNRKGFLFWKDNSETTIILDINYQKISRTKTTSKQPVEQTSIPFDQVKNITLYSVDYSPMPEFQWPAAITFDLVGGLKFAFNSSQLGEMESLANKIAKLINKSVEEKNVNNPKDFPK